MATIELDIVLLDGETPDMAALAVQGKFTATYELIESGNCHQGVRYVGEEDQLKKIQQRYGAMDKPKPHLHGKPPVAKGQKRI